jgi:hypothetical protein
MKKLYTNAMKWYHWARDLEVKSLSLLETGICQSLSVELEKQ